MKLLRIRSDASGERVPSHNAPRPYIAILLSGESEMEASNGEVRRLHRGDLLLCEDLTGKGHKTLALADTVIAFVSRSDHDSEA